MPGVAAETSLLEELDARQEEVLTRLDELNGRIEALLQEYTGLRATGEEASAATV